MGKSTSTAALCCGCGSGRKTTKYHPSGAEVIDSSFLAADERVKQTLWSLGQNLCTTLKGAIEAISINRADADETAYRICLSFHARKILRVTLAGQTLVRFSQSTQALTLKREQYYAWVAFHYYLDHRSAAILFTASQPLRQRDSARKRLELSVDPESDVNAMQQLRILADRADTAYKEFPALRVVKGKSANTSNPKMIDWSEPCVTDMLREVVKDWPRQLAEMGESLEDENSWIDAEVRRIHLYHDQFMSQDVHGTPMAMSGEFEHASIDHLGSVELTSHDPNGILYIYLWYPLGVLDKIIGRLGVRGFRHRNIVLFKAAMGFKEEYG
jgi:hypothetical protein